MPPDAWLQKRTNFSTLIVGLARTGNQTRATCMAGSGTNGSAIHYDFLRGLLFTGCNKVEGVLVQKKIQCLRRLFPIQMKVNTLFRQFPKNFVIDSRAFIILQEEFKWMAECKCCIFFYKWPPFDIR
jgi:hypothetical protein